MLAIVSLLCCVFLAYATLDILTEFRATDAIFTYCSKYKMVKAEIMSERVQVLREPVDAVVISRQKWRGAK